MTDATDLIERLRALAKLRIHAPLHAASETEGVWLNDAADEIERLRAALVAAMEIVQEDRAAFAMANIWPDGRMDNDDGDVLRRYDAVIAQADAALGGEG